jgi:hypothetical protein
MHPKPDLNVFLPSSLSLSLLFFFFFLCRGGQDRAGPSGRSFSFGSMTKSKKDAHDLVTREAVSLSTDC